MRERLTILNSFVHDVATGTWISSLLFMRLAHAETRGAPWAGVPRELVRQLEAQFMAITWTSLAVVVATGLVRALTFRAYGWTGDVARDRIRMLKLKHALLGATFLAGTLYQVLLLRT
ncbi:hypothetical protein [Anaeromyxobacter paludicola]|uniref:Uncharacterized protein n=1 Tax=Anaeromyxobacter paludicola TaxID=2918171 RepID=A0ABN6N9N9_9BACT|nr:hypothetical protein [Anaeromyxobacter paludicola]BDG08834.1 hypothetical protein AMPC_19470 [Anaeromyxobacter paludicola]